VDGNRRRFRNILIITGPSRCAQNPFASDTYRRAFCPMFFPRGQPPLAEPSAPSGVPCLEKEGRAKEVNNPRNLSGDRTLIRFGTGDEVTICKARTKKAYAFAGSRVHRLTNPSRGKRFRS